MEVPYDRAFDLCIGSLRLFRRCRVIEQDRYAGRIIARTGINWKTWGDTISFEVSGIDEGRTHIKISSRPTARTTLTDFGKNRENVERIVLFLKK